MATLADLIIEIGIDTDRVAKGALAIQRHLDRAWRKVDESAGMAMKTMLAVPSVIPAIGAGAVAVGGLAASFVAAGAAAGVFGAVTKSAMTEVGEHATKVEDLYDKMKLYAQQAKLAEKYGQEPGKYLDKQAKAALELHARLENLPPATRDATLAFLGMKSNWGDFVEQNKPAVFGLMAQGYSLIAQNIGKLQPFFDAGRAAAQRLFTAIKLAVDNGLLERMASRAGPALSTLTSIIINTAQAIGRTFGKIGQQQGDGFLQWLERATAKWRDWASATESGTGINRFLEATSGGAAQQALQLLRDIATAAMNVARAVAPLAPVTAAVASALASLIAAVPPGVLTALVAGWLAYGVALKAYALYQGIATAATWAANSALLASPITWVVLGIAAIVAGIVLLATKTKFFQTIWAAVWGFMKAVGRWFAGPFANFFVQLGAKIASQFNRMKQIATSVVNGIVSVFRWYWNTYSSIIGWVIRKGGQMVSFFRSVPGKIGGALRGVFNPLWQGFRSIVNRIVGAWNNLSFTVGGGSFMGVDIPSVTVNTPNIPMLANGGIVTRPTLAMIGEGGEDEAVVPLSRLPELAGRDDGRPVVVEIVPGGERDFRRWINKTVRVRGALRTEGV